LDEYFGISIEDKVITVFPAMARFKIKTESIALGFARKHYAFTFDLLFYDVTTLYFEAFEEDELRKNGYSKDNKSQQPPNISGINGYKEGFPIAYEVFAAIPSRGTPSFR